jgi:hypothetical protein
MSTDIELLSDLKSGDTILYQGSRYKVDSVDSVIAKLTSVQTNKSININQGQINQFGVKVIS